ncbi:hypothetical protein [Nocardia otitidiscaviarum]|nr:hypothetical protein [Nocardia otitidiscaviarum]
MIGWKLLEDDIRRVEIPHKLLGYLEPGSCLGARLEDSGHGTFYLEGEPITDPAELSQMKILEYEQSIEVPKAREIRPDDDTP